MNINIWLNEWICFPGNGFYPVQFEAHFKIYWLFIWIWKGLPLPLSKLFNVCFPMQSMQQCILCQHLTITEVYTQNMSKLKLWTVLKIPSSSYYPFLWLPGAFVDIEPSPISYDVMHLQQRAQTARPLNDDIYKWIVGFPQEGTPFWPETLFIICGGENTLTSFAHVYL
jgi:hypothetical protein